MAKLRKYPCRVGDVITILGLNHGPHTCVDRFDGALDRYSAWYEAGRYRYTQAPAGLYIRFESSDGDRYWTRAEDITSVEAPPEPDSDAVATVVKTMTSYTGARGTGSFGYHNGRRMTSFHNHPCHARLSSIRNPEVVYSFCLPRFGVPKGEGYGMHPMKEKEVTPNWSDFNRWLVTDSPWAFVFPTDELMIDGVNVNGQDFRDTYGYVWRKQDLEGITGQALGNALIASRQAFEKNLTFAMWVDAVAKGADPAIAFFWMGGFQTTGRADSFQHMRMAGHWPFNAHSMSEKNVIDYARGITGGGAKGREPASKSCDYYPCNVMWEDTNNGSIGTPYFNEAIKRLAAVEGVKKGTGYQSAFGSAASVPSVDVTKDQIVQFMCDESDYIRGKVAELNVGS